MSQFKDIMSNHSPTAPQAVSMSFGRQNVSGGKFTTIIYLIAISICLISCDPNQTYTNDRYADTIVINFSDIKESIPVSSLFKKVDFIPLETNDECLIGEIDKLLLYNNLFFILDQMTSSLFVFSQKGEFIHKIHQVGEGPDEYIDLDDFFIDKENNFLILFADSKLLFYDLHTYKLIKEEKLSPNTSIAYFGDTYVHFLNNGIWSGKFNIVAKRDGQTIYESLPISENNVGYTYSSPFPFSQPMDNNEVFFAEIFNNTIYLLNRDSIIVKYYIDFGNKSLPAKYFESIPVQERTKRVLETKYCFFLSGYYRNDKLFKFNFLYDGTELNYYNFFDRREEFIFTSFTDDLYLGVAPWQILYVNNDYVVSFHDVNRFKDGLKSHNMILDKIPEYEKDKESEETKNFLQSFKINHELYYETLKELARKDDEDNYIITKWYYEY